ncbi:hypothetical protein [uncultured Streptomyces sp.]|uniref:hypothetical protein n=1 Tax=uncultured Streptomyces sp. TaxID=174707 RepID=UPI0026050CFE|nr:hypothetical protein [uncultured Streptomyces sp.]
MPARATANAHTRTAEPARGTSVGTDYRHLYGTGPPDLLALMADVAVLADEIEGPCRAPAAAPEVPGISYRGPADPVPGRVAGTPNG